MISMVLVSMIILNDIDVDIKVNYKGEESIVKSFVHYANYPDGIKKFYIGIDQYKQNPYILSYIAQEYIVE